MSELQKRIMKSHLPPPVPRDATRKRGGRQTDYSPTMWDEYFTVNKVVQIEENEFHVYLSNEPAEPGPLVVLLHGGGYSALTWAIFSQEITKLINCQCLAIDCRGHGLTHCTDEDDLSSETLARDVGSVLNKLYAENAPPMIIVGHSMGGAIAVNVAHMQLIPTLIACTVIDVVEGTAMDALASMQSFLRSRPAHFRSIPHAIEWSVRSGQIRNLDSAKVSIPGQIINSETRLSALSELPLPVESLEDDSISKFCNPTAIPEDEEEHQFKPPAKIDPASPKGYEWRIDLSKTEKFWCGWFEGLSQKFLDLPVPKLLLLASIDGLDRCLTVGQMQGKFQMHVLPRVGHVIHEDRPHEVAEVIASFMIRNRFTQAIGDFIGQMPAC